MNPVENDTFYGILIGIFLTIIATLVIIVITRNDDGPRPTWRCETFEDSSTLCVFEDISIVYDPDTLQWNEK